MGLPHKPNNWISLLRNLFPNTYRQLEGQVQLPAGSGTITLPIDFKPYQVDIDIKGGICYLHPPCAPPEPEFVEVEVAKVMGGPWGMVFKWNLGAPKLVDWEAYGFVKKCK